MKALTVYQPHATLIAISAKEYETRGWATNYRGPLAIHAAKASEALFELAREAGLYREGLPHSQFAHAVFDALKQSGCYPSPFALGQLPRGAIVCTCDLVACIPADTFTPQFPESVFGFFGPGRFAWKLANVKFFDEPIPASGKQGLWDWNPEKVTVA